jgi:hypothetical protein
VLDDDAEVYAPGVLTEDIEPEDDDTLGETVGSL